MIKIDHYDELWYSWQICPQLPICQYSSFFLQVISYKSSSHYLFRFLAHKMILGQQSKKLQTNGFSVDHTVDEHSWWCRWWWLMMVELEQAITHKDAQIKSKAGKQIQIVWLEFRIFSLNLRQEKVQILSSRCNVMMIKSPWKNFWKRLMIEW